MSSPTRSKTGKLASRLPMHVPLAPCESWMPDAATVARLAVQDHAAGELDVVWELAPVYYRRSAAEEKFPG